MGSTAPPCRVPSRAARDRPGDGRSGFRFRLVAVVSAAAPGAPARDDTRSSGAGGVIPKRYASITLGRVDLALLDALSPLGADLT
jgi:hypothetical protein